MRRSDGTRCGCTADPRGAPHSENCVCVLVAEVCEDAVFCTRLWFCEAFLISYRVLPNPYLLYEVMHERP